MFLISLLWFLMSLLDPTGQHQRNGGAYQNTCVYLFVHLSYIFTNPESWNNDLEKECLSKGIQTLRVTDDCKLFLT